MGNIPGFCYFPRLPTLAGWETQRIDHNKSSVPSSVSKFNVWWTSTKSLTPQVATQSAQQRSGLA